MPYTYTVIINKDIADTGSYTYSFRSTKKISMDIRKNRAKLSLSMSVFKSCEDFLNSYLFRDAAKKMIMLHSILYGSRLVMKSVTLRIDDNEYTLNKADEGFPRLITILPKTGPGLPEAWKEKEFIQYLLTCTKKGGEKDQRFSAIESFLASKGKEYEIDIFTNLWTSMNAYYTYVATSCNNYLAGMIEDKKDFPELAGNDSDCINLLVRLMNKNPDIHRVEVGEKSSEMFHKIGTEVVSLSDEELIKLYEKAREELTNGSKGNDRLKAKFPVFQKLASENSVDLFFLILLVFPYLCRCAFLHGKRPTLLTFFENEYEQRYLNKINIILNRYLSEILTSTFDPDEYGAELIADCYAKSFGKKDKRKKAANMLKNILDTSD
ncbi:MAG: hypothetical protein GXY08_10650 [Ruminococcus sp.]|nr:hypothetical protein [Ruminococcus sp.]